MDIVDFWVDSLLKKYNVEDLYQLPVYAVKGEIYEMKGTLMNEEAFLAGGSEHAKENIENIKKYISVLKEVLEENNMNTQRVWVVLQNNRDGFLDDTEVVGVFTDFDAAEKVRAKLMDMYTQYYYIKDVMLDLDIWTDK
jgi:hypothetical protein